MATKKTGTQAQRAASGSKKKTSGTKSASSGSRKNTAVVKTEYEQILPTDTIIGLVALGLFVLFLIVAINPEGTLPTAIRTVMLGILGDVGFYLLIPGLFYIFCIHMFGRKSRARMRLCCTLAFVLISGTFFHLVKETQEYSGTLWNNIVKLYNFGADGKSGGVICGGLGEILRNFCGSALAFILLAVSGILNLAGALRITLPGLIRAFHNRPREQEEETPPEDEVDPAAVVVNHLANRRIEHNRQRRQRLEIAQQPVVVGDFPEEDDTPQEETAQPAIPAPAAETSEEAPAPVKKRRPIAGKSRGEDILSQIGDISSPVGAALASAPAKTPEQGGAVPANDVDSIPKSMPELILDETPTTVSAPVKNPATPQMDPTSAPAKSEKVTSKDAAESARQVAAEIAQTQTVHKSAYCFPPIELLKRPLRNATDGTVEMRENSRRLNETLASFKIDAHIINVTRGPSVTRYEVELDKGVRLNKLTSCADDIALSLGASGVRIAAVAGKISIVGIEVPNRAVTTVSLREVIDSQEFHKSHSKTSFAVGKDIGGSCIVDSISKMPHMLIAGTTGSGKSVCMNSLIISLLYKAGPEDVKLIMVDPKMVELANYNGIPHLMIPVVTDPKKAAGALQWAVTEMMRRYRAMSDAGVRDLESYNSIVQAEDGEKIPQLVVIIDELADLMLVAAKEVEDSICRIAQMGRAAGIHLVIATQRPSSDVITGLMKANIPSRIAFSVASAMESRIILDTMGAEKLVGKGDMLFAPTGCGKPLRVQGCFVTDGEVEAVTSYIKDNYTADYDQDILEDIEKRTQKTAKKSSAGMDVDPVEDEFDGDEMLPAAVDVILETGQASVSMLQRRLKLGYARAARIVDEMEEKGIVGPFQGSKPRSILITKEQWAANKDGQPTQLAFDDLPAPEEDSPF